MSHDSDGLRTLLRSARGTATLLAKQSAAAQSLVTDEEDAIDALVTCCALLLREHDVGLNVALSVIKILAALAEGEETSWRDLAWLREQPLSPALAGCDEHHSQQLHTIAEVLQFPKAVSLLLQRQLVVFRIRRDAAAGGSDTATLVRAEPALAPLLKQAEEAVEKHWGYHAWPSGLTLGETPAFWRGFFGDPEDLESLDTGRRERDHIAFGSGWLLSGRGLLPDLLQAPAPSFVDYLSVIGIAAAAVGDVATLAALHHARRYVDSIGSVCVAASAGQVEVIRLALALGWRVFVSHCLRSAAEADLSSETRLRILSLFTKSDLDSLGAALAAFAKCGDVQCVQRLLRLCHFEQRQLDGAVVQAASGGHIPIMTLLLEHGAALPSAAFKASANVAVLQWCVERGCTVDSEFVQEAAVAGRLFQLEWAASVTDVSELLNADLFVDVATTTHIPVMEWLRAQGCPWDWRVLDEACCFMRWESTAFALRNGCPLDGFCVRDLGGLSVEGLKAAVQALHDSGRGEAVDLASLFSGAARADNVEAAEWLVCDFGFPISADDCATWPTAGPLGYHAAARGCLRLLQHLHSKGLHSLCPADMRAVFKSRGCPFRNAGTRSIEVVRWLHAQGVPTHGPSLGRAEYKPQPREPAVHAADFLSCEAASVGALELLQVLVEECGAHWTESACVAAVEEGHMEVLCWAISKHCPCAVDTWCAAVRRAGTRGDYRPLAMLHSAKRPWNEAVWSAAAPYEEVRAWLKERGCPGSQAAPAAGAGAGAGAAAGATLA